MKTRTSLLTLMVAAGLVSACATQRYDAEPVAPERVAAEFRERSLESAELHTYMVSQGYPESAFPIKAWGLRELTLVAFFYHPQLDVARAQWRGAQAGEISAGQKPNPGISAGAEHHSKSGGGVSPWTLGLGFDIPIEASGKRQARVDRATSLSEAARIEIGQSAWEVRSRLRNALLAYQNTLRQASLLKREVAVRENIVDMLQKRLEAGMVSDIELVNARLQLQKAQQTLEAEKGRIPELRAALAASAGLPAHTMEAIRIDANGVNQPIPAEQLPGEDVRRAALLNRLDIRSALARYDAAEAKLRLEIAKQHPDITLSPGYTFDQGDIRWSLGLSLILALLNKNEGPIAEARAQREVEAEQFNALQARVIGEEEQALARYRAALEEQAKAERLLAAQQQRFSQSERQFAAGYADRMELTSLRLETLVAEQGVLTAQIKGQRALGALEDAIQRPLDEGTLLPAVPEARPSMKEPQS